MLGRLHVASDSEEVVRQLEKYTATVVDCLETVNRRLNGDPPSLSLDKMKQLDRGLAAAISEIITECMSSLLRLQRVSCVPDSVTSTLTLAAWRVSAAKARSYRSKPSSGFDVEPWISMSP